VIYIYFDRLQTWLSIGVAAGTASPGAAGRPGSADARSV